MQRWLAWAGLMGVLSLHGVAVAAIATTVTNIFGVAVMRAQLLTSVTATFQGEWVDVSGLNVISLDVRGITSATVEIDGSNEPTRPADSSHGIKLNGTDITVDQVVVVTMPVRWLKARIVSYVSGNITVNMEGHGGGGS